MRNCRIKCIVLRFILFFACRCRAYLWYPEWPSPTNRNRENGPYLIPPRLLNYTEPQPSITSQISIPLLERPILGPQNALSGHTLGIQISGTKLENVPTRQLPTPILIFWVSLFRRFTLRIGIVWQRMATEMTMSSHIPGLRAGMAYMCLTCLMRFSPEECSGDSLHVWRSTWPDYILVWAIGAPAVSKRQRHLPGHMSRRVYEGNFCHCMCRLSPLLNTSARIFPQLPKPRFSFPTFLKLSPACGSLILLPWAAESKFDSETPTRGGPLSESG